MLIKNNNKTRLCLHIAMWLPCVTWMLFIFSLSQWSGPKQTPSFWFNGADKCIHGALFGMLSVLLFVPLRYERKLSIFRSLILAFIITSFYGFTDELHQLFISTRSADVYDWLADTLGAVIALLFIGWGSVKYERKYTK